MCLFVWLIGFFLGGGLLVFCLFGFYLFIYLFFCSCDVKIPSPGMISNTRTIDVTVNRDCIDRRDLVYSLARILGLPDQHTRPDRDKFLTIHWDNIKIKYILIS